MQLPSPRTRASRCPGVNQQGWGGLPPRPTSAWPSHPRDIGFNHSQHSRYEINSQHRSEIFPCTLKTRSQSQGCGITPPQPQILAPRGDATGRMSLAGCQVPPHRLRSHVRLAGRVLIAFAGFLFPSYHGSILQLPRCPAARSPWFITSPLPFQPPICFLCFCILSWKKNHFLLNFSAWVGFRRPPARLPRAASFLIPHGGTTPSFPPLAQHHPETHSSCQG